jgi:hypothetical protein
MSVLAVSHHTLLTVSRPLNLSGFVLIKTGDSCRQWVMRLRSHLKQDEWRWTVGEDLDLLRTSHSR